MISSTRTSSLVAGLALALLGLGGCATRLPPLTAEEARQEVTEAELAFARTMANRDLAAFGSFIAEDAVFINGDRPLRGRQAVVEAWAPLFQGAEAPFSWVPDRVEIAAGNSLGYTSGPVTSSSGRQTGWFHTVWQRQRDGSWRVVFDSGSD